jgi:anti-sigma factor RsiW
MNCEQWCDKLDAYVDGEEGDFTGLEEHLRSCPSCTAEVLSRVQLKSATRAASARYTPSQEFRLRVEKSVRAKRGPVRFILWIPSLTAAIATLLIVVSVVLWDRHQVQQQAVVQLVDLHVAALASPNPVDVVSSDRHTVKPWFQGKLPFTFNIPELAGSPFKLLGGKLVYIHDQPAAHLLFELRKHELSVFIAQETKGAFSTGESETRENGFSVESWTQDGLRYAVVSDTNSADVHELGNLLQAAAKQ